MIKKYYILALTFLCLFVGQVSYGQGNGDYYGDEDEKFCFDCINLLEEVVITPEPKENVKFCFDCINQLDEVVIIKEPTEEPRLDWCECCDIGCTQVSPPVTDPIVYDDPEDPCPSGDECECFGICPDETEPVKDPCTTNCPEGFTQNPDCSCIKKVDDDCKSSLPETDITKRLTINPGDIVNLKGPFYFASINDIPKNLVKTSRQNVKSATLVSGFDILQHGNYIEVPSLSYLAVTNLAGTLFGIGGFSGQNCSTQDTFPVSIAPTTPIDFVLVDEEPIEPDRSDMP